MLTSKLEVLVEFGAGDDKALETTLKELKSRKGVTEAVFKEGAILVETTLPSTEVLELVSKSSGRRAVLQGFGESQSAVCTVSSRACCSGAVLGVVRFQQTGEGPLLADGCIDGLAPGAHGLHVHEAGDLSQGCNTIGGHFNPAGAPHGDPADPARRHHAGDLGNIHADRTGRATFRITSDTLKVWDIIGRSVAVTERADDLGRGTGPQSTVDGDAGATVGCGIIARAAAVYQNPKRICACDGVVVWDERDRPLAGRGRRASGTKNTNCCGRETENSPNCCGKKTENTLKSCGKETANTPKSCGKETENTLKCCGKETENTPKCCGKETANIPKCCGKETANIPKCCGKETANTPKCCGKETENTPKCCMA